MKSPPAGKTHCGQILGKWVRQRACAADWIVPPVLQETIPGLARQRQEKPAGITGGLERPI